MIRLTFDDGSDLVIPGGEWRSVRKGGMTGVARVRTLAVGDAIVGEDGSLTTIVGVATVDCDSLHASR